MFSDLNFFWKLHNIIRIQLKVMQKNLDMKLSYKKKKGKALKKWENHAILNDYRIPLQI